MPDDLAHTPPTTALKLNQADDGWWDMLLMSNAIVAQRAKKLKRRYAPGRVLGGISLAGRRVS